LNWSGDAIPGTTNDVIINIASNVVIVSRSNVTVRNVQNTGGLLITNSDFVVTSNASFVNGLLAIANARSFTAQGSNTTFTANGPAAIAGANLYANSGARLEFTALGSHADAGIQYQTRVWQAAGANSVIRFSALTNLTGALNGSMQMRGQNGGRIELPALTAFQPSYVYVFADGLNSRWDAPVLTNSPRNSSDFEARNGATVSIPSVTQWRDATLVIRATNSFIPTAQLTVLSNVSLVADRFSPNLSNVVEIPLSSFYAENGGRISLPGVRAYTNQVPQYQSREFRATGAGSLVDLNNVTNFANPSAGSGTLYVRAYTGGQVLLAGVTQAASSRLYLWSDGAGSLVDLASLASSPAGGTSIEARNGGTMNIPNLTAPTELNLTVRDTNSVFPMTQFTTLANSALTVDAVNLTLSNVVEAALASLYVEGGGRLTLPNLRSYTNQVPQYQSREFRATGAGSVLDLNSITNLANATGAGTLYIRAYSGGQVLLAGVTAVPASQFYVWAEGANSRIDLPNLLNSPGGGTSFEARNGGFMNFPNLVYATNIDLVVRGTNSSFPLFQITSIAGSSLVVDAINLTLSNVVDAALASIYVENGGRLALPALTSYSAAVPTYQTREFRATGAGSVLDLSALTMLQGGLNGNLLVRAYSGGRILLDGITTLPPSRFTFWGEGAGSLVSLSNLVNSPRAGSDFEVRTSGAIQFPLVTEAEEISLVLRSGGVMPTAQLVSVSNSTVIVDGTAPDFNAVTNAGTSSLYAENGGRLSLPGVTGYASGIPNFSSRVWQANGANSVLEVTNLAEITHGPTAYGALLVRSYWAGRVRLDQLARISNSTVEIYSERANSRIELPALTNASGGGTFEANLGGTIQLTTNSLLLSNFNVLVRTDSTISAGDLELRGSSVLYGNGTLMANVINAAAVRPGASAGSLTVSNYTQLTNGTLQAEIGGTTPTNGFDLLNVIGNATLDGQLDVVRINNYAPALGSVHRFINAGARAGEFSRFTGLNAGASTEFVPGYDATGAFLTAAFSTGPVATNAAPRGVVSGSISFFDITFNEAINFGTMQTNDAIITGPSGTIFVTGLNLFGGRRARFSFPVQSAPGIYTIVVGPNIADTVGNNMNQDSDATNGEATDDRYTNAVTLTAADLAVSNVTAPASAAPGQSIPVSYTVQNVGVDPVVDSFVNAVLLSTDGSIGGDTLIGFTTFTQPLATGAVFTVTQNVIVPIFGPAGNLRVVAQLDYHNTLAESSEANNAALSAATLVVPQTLQFQVTPNTVEETGSAISALVSRNGDVTGALTVNLLSSDTTELTLPASANIPAGQNSVSVALTPVHDSIADGAQLVGVTASAGGFVSASNSVTVLDVDTPRLTLSSSSNALAEGSALTVTVTRDVVSAEPLLVTLASSSPGQLSVPATVTIASNAASADFPITGVEDTLVESPHGYTITASASNHLSTNKVFTVYDNDVPALTWSLDGSVSEGGSLSATLTRSFVSPTALAIDLVSSLPSRLNAPSTVSIPAGQSGVTFTLSAVENTAIDGNAAVTVTAYPLETQSGDRLAGTQTALIVNDNDGPTLLVAVSRDAVAEGQSVSATVTRNTPATNDLLVSLTCDDTTEATVPASLVLANGQTSTTFTVSAVDDGVSDGGVSVRITASALNFTDGSDTVLVTDVNLPDLTITSLTVPTNGLTGENFNITFREMNLGFANATGSWLQVVYLSDDPYPGDDEELTSFAFSGDVAPGLFVERSTQLRAPLTPGDYWIIVRTDTSNSVTELIEENNSAVAAVPLRVDPSYTATVQIAGDRISPANTPMPMVGSAEHPDGSPAQFELVNIHITVKGTKRIISALTDGSGEFSATFTPLPNEGGSYTIGATHPGVTEAPVQDWFMLTGMRFDPATLNTQVVALTSITGVVNLINLADVPLVGLTASLIGVNPAVNITATVGDTLPASGVLPVELRITSLVDAPLTNVFTVRITDSGNNTVDLRVTNKVVQLLPRLVAVPSSLEAGMRRGEQTIVPFTIMNLGGAESGPLTVQLPNESFLHLSSPAVIDSIPAGGSNTVTLQLLAATNQPLGVYLGTIGVSGTNSSVTVPYSFRSLSDAIGSLQIEVVDELTYYAVGSPRVSNATVIVRDSISRAVVTNGVTGSNGLFTASNLTEGYYDLEVTADQHSTYRATILTPAGGNTNVTAFISRQVVRYVWTVVPTEIEDRTRISIETVFETFVPIPVVTVEPSLIDLADYTNEVTQIDMKIQNHGLIAAQNMKINFGSHPDWSFTPLITEVGTLNAQSSITVPLTIRRLTPFPDAAKRQQDAGGTLAKSGGGLVAPKQGGGGCSITASVTWTLICANANNGYGAGITIINADSSGCPGGGYVRPPGGPGGGGGFIHPIGYVSPTDCNPCDGDITEAVLDCLIGFTPLGLGWDLAGNTLDCYDDISTQGWAGVPGCAQSFAVTGLEELIGLTPLGLPYDILKCIYDILDAACGGTGGAPDGSKAVAAAVPSYNLTLLGIHKERLEDYLAPQVYLYGSENWLAMEAASPTVMSNLFLTFATAIATNSEDGMRVSASERAAMEALPRPLHINATEVTRLLDRWNRTLDYADLGIYTSTNVPFGMNPDFIASDIMLQKLTAANTAGMVNEAEGFPFITDGVQYALEDLNRQIGGGSGDVAKARAKAGGGVCAQVRLRIDQEAVITRDAFAATLELINGSATPLENISVSLVVRRDDASDATSLFGITAPVLANLSDVSGTGVVVPGLTGSAMWTIIPTDEAAPTADTVTYFVSGTLRYRQDGLDVTVPLAPAAIDVLPNPNLRLKYFHERDVLADDPFTTNVVEPSQPYSLAVMVQNTGYGTARNMRISSSQPQIIENEKGLLIDFDIIATEVAGQNISPSLTVNFGDIGPGGIAIGRWLLKSTLQGQFVEYSATFEHLDGLGDPRLSLIESVEIHELIRVVKATNGLNDALPDFLVNDFPDERFLPDTLYFSDATTAPVTPVTTFLTAQTPTTSNLNAQLQAALPAGWSYLRIPDPANGRFKLTRVVRSDGAELPVENFWVSDRTFIAGGQRPLYETNLHLLDFDSTGNYTLMYSVPPAPDTTAPASSIAALPAESYANIPLTWAGSDNVGGSGVATFDVYVSDNGGAFTRWLANTALRGAVFGGISGHTYAFYTRARDAAGNLEAAPATADATTTVSRTNSPPSLVVGGTQTVNEGAVVTILNSASDVDPDALTFALGVGSPGGATINSAGTVTWVTGEGNGPSTNVITIVVNDNGVPPLSTTGTVTVVVNEVNSPPSIATITNRVVNENQLLTLQVFASDSDVPANAVTFRLGTAPPGAVIGTNSGVLTWTPNSSQGPSTNVVAVIATDNGVPPLSATQMFSVIVRNTEGDFTLSIGSTNVLLGSNSAVPIVLNSSLDITNVSVSLETPQSRLTGLVLSPTAPALASAVLLPNGTDRSELRFTTAAGQVLDAAQTLASLGFTASGSNSAIVPLTFSSLVAWRSTGLALTNGRAFSGQVIVIGEQPVLTLERPDALTLYGQPFHYYEVITSESVEEWPIIGDLYPGGFIDLQSNTFQRVTVPMTNVPPLFFRARPAESVP